MSRISDVLVDLFAEAIFQVNPVGDWDVVIIPGPDSAPIGFFVLEQPGVLLNSRLRVSLLMQNPAMIDRDAALSVVRQAVEALEKQRSEQLAEGNGVTPSSEVAGLHGAVLL